MIVCICEGVNDRTVRAAIRSGASSVRAVRKACGAGKQCGMCSCDVREMIAEHRREQQAQRQPPLAAK